MSLTDDWVNGDLFGCFWCKHQDGHIEAHQLTGFKHNNPMKIEVIGPCDYEELQRLESDRLAKIEGEEIIAELKMKINNLRNYDNEHRKEIKRLKNLLKRCRTWMSWAYAELYEYDSEHESKDTENLISRIDAVLGESEER